MDNPDTAQIVQKAWKAGVVVPAFNIPYLPMIMPVVRALRDTQTIGLIQAARPDWEKFESKSPEAVRNEYERVKDELYTRLHLDHVPVIDEEGKRVDFLDIIARAIRAGYQSIMVDGSRLSLEDNIAATQEVVDMAHAAGIPVEAELGAVLGHEAGPLPSYEELFASGQGFTDPDEATRFVKETDVDWLSISFGNIHGAISGAAKSQKKVEARLNIEHLDRISNATGIPLVLHGGSGIKKESLCQAFHHGIAKINIGTTIRQAYEKAVEQSEESAQEAVYETTVGLIRNELEAVGSANVIMGK